MKEEIRYLKLFVWCSLLFIWVLLNKLMRYDSIAIAIVGIPVIAAVVMLIAKVRRYTCITPLHLPLSDNSIAALFLVLGLGNLVDYGDASYYFLVIVTVVGVAIDTYNRHFDRDC